jgi:replicative DNA helicase
MNADSQNQAKRAPRFIEPEEARVRWLKSLDDRDRRRYFTSGFKVHDRTVGALLRGILMLIVARPSVGKTSFEIAMAYRLAVAGIKVYFASLEMTVPQVWNRLACVHDADLKLRDLTEGDFTPERVRYIEQLSRQLVNFSPSFVEDSDFGRFEKAVVESVKPGSDSVIFVDYLGLFSLKGLGPQEKFWLVSEISRRLKLAAVALDVPIIAAVQANRQVENRKEKFLTLADLRDSGQLEADADMVLALTRDGSTLDVDVLKNRNGPTASYSLRFDAPRAAVEELD